MSQDIDDLREQTERTNRVTTATEESTEPPLSEQIVDELVAIDDGKNPSVGTRSNVLAAVLYALDDRDELGELNQMVYDELDSDLDVELDSKSALVELAIRYAFQEAAEDYGEALTEAKREYADRKL